MTHYVIIGNGAAGATAAETIRQQDRLGEITLVSAEPYPMYSRPGLAYVLMQEIPDHQVVARKMEWYAALRLNLVYSQATSLDVTTQRVGLANGRFLSYDRLLIATGARAVPPPYPGSNLDGVVYLDTLDGTKDILRRLKRTKRAVVIGGGITALEMSEGLAHQGVDTHYFVRRDRLWSQVFNEAESKLLEERMQAHHVHIHYNTEVTEILGDRRGRVKSVRRQDGSEFACNLIGIAIGVQPQLDLLRETPIQTDRAILVNEYLQTNVRHVYAAGDCAQVYDRWTGKHMLDVLWPTAVSQGRIVGLNMVGQLTPYVKGSPFNACLLFGLHITVMGQINPRHKNEEPQVVQHLSRGSSEVWFTFPRAYQSAWAEDGPNTIRLILSGEHLVGAVVIGEQSLADPLRHIIENQVTIGDWQTELSQGGQPLRQRLHHFWQEQKMKR